MSAVPGFPFSAVVGHDDLRLALVLNAVHPGVGGVLVRGEKGTAKSTAVRALAALLPQVAVVDGCRFGCAPAAPDPGCPDGPHPAGPSAHTRAARLVELPVGATEDRLVGSLDLERALAEGVRAYQPGLLAEAHRGVLYVDEVNLLHDHLVDLLLDAAAMGRAHVERDGVSITHPSRFLLVGTMNPEEGELRPQLLDRFGLTVEVRAARDVDTRVEVVRRRIAFEADPEAFAAAWADQEEATARRIAEAQARVADVELSDRELRRIASVCAQFDVDGMRADLVIARAAVAHAAWRGAAAVTEQDVRVAARLALPHRRRRDPFDEPGLDEKVLDEALRNAEEELDPEPDPDGPGPEGGAPADGSPGADRDPEGKDPESGGAAEGGRESSAGTDGGGDPDAGRAEGSEGENPSAPSGPRADGTPPQACRTDAPSVQQQPGDASEQGQVITLGRAGRVSARLARRLEVPGVGEGTPGRRSRARTAGGRIVRSADGAPRRAADLHLLATVAAAAPHQRARGRNGAGLVLLREDLRGAVREGREGNLVLFVVDASGSMAARRRMTVVSGAILALLRDAYQRRDKVGLVTFRARGAELVLPPTSSVPTAQARMASMRTGGRTPLADGLLLARRTLAAERVRDPRRRPLVVLLTDGRATVPAKPGNDPVTDACRAAGLLAADGAHVVVVDCESGFVRLGLAARVAAAAGAPSFTVDELTPESLTHLAVSA